MKRFGIFVNMVGTQAGGPEIYENGLVKSLAKIDKKNEYHVFCLHKEAKESFSLKQENIKYHVLWPKTRIISLTASFPISLIKNNIKLFHATFVPPLFHLEIIYSPCTAQ